MISKNITFPAKAFFPFFIFLLLLSCTYSPWHRQQSDIFLTKGIAYLDIGQYSNALKELLEAEKYYSGNPKVHYFLAMAYHGKGLKDKAMEELQKAVSLDGQYSEAHNYLGTLYSDRGQWDQAIDEFEKALANPLYETPSLALYNMGWAYYGKKKYHDALLKYQQALNVDPLTTLRPQIEKNIGLIYFDQNIIAEAIRHFRKAVELDAALVDAHFLLGESYLKMKDNKNAKLAFQEVVKRAPDSTFGARAKTYLRTL
jgi:Tfp pilus assembly protein PilF